LGHGILAIQGKAVWITWIEQMLSVDASTAALLLLLIGIADVGIAIFVLVQPLRNTALGGNLGILDCYFKAHNGRSNLGFYRTFCQYRRAIGALICARYSKKFKTMV
jgi:hypothetical protein|tara:strand:+ start:525 stop:845 length:321 start_codon:yes stop_codon:yes gene_type:complete